ncbi:MAG: hypothetical protein RR350_05115 [Oscillibacter sp.]
MHGEILALARALSGAGQAEINLLELLCTAAEAEWTRRLRSGITAADCGGAFQCAAAFVAVAMLSSGRGGGESTAAFTAGSVSVSQKSAGETMALAGNLRAQAEKLMAPYVAEDDFAFCGVRG